jgi:hypothetical protein
VADSRKVRDEILDICYYSVKNLSSCSPFSKTLNTELNDCVHHFLHIAYDRKSWLLILRTKHEVQVSMNEVLQKIFEPKGI